MRLQAGRSREDFLTELRASAESTWGAERAGLLAATLEASANALWRLADSPLDFLEDEPDYVRGGARGAA